jgi:hypothetical protein
MPIPTSRDRARGAVPVTAAIALAWLVAGACMTSPAATPEVLIEGIRARPPGDPALAAAAFLGGCWRGTSLDGGTILEERWTPPEDGLMLGLTRVFREGGGVDFSFALLRADSAGIHYLPHPGGRASGDPLRLARSAPGRLVFEAGAAGDPRRIRYLLRDGSLEVHVGGAGGAPDPRRWTLARIACD